MQQVVRGPGGFLAAGVASFPGSGPTLKAWFSPDGIEWEFVASAQPTVGMDMEALAVAPDGTFLILGRGIWESGQGRDWFRSLETGAFVIEAFAGDTALGCDGTTCRTYLLQR
jgi:hypothetical protein